MTLFRLIASSCNLTIPQAAKYLGMPVPTAKAYWYGLRPTPPAAIVPLHALSLHMGGLADNLVAAIRGMLPDITAEPQTLYLRRVGTTMDARQYQLPFASCHEAVLQRVLAALPAAAVMRIQFRDSGDDVEIGAEPEAAGKGRVPQDNRR